MKYFKYILMTIWLTGCIVGAGYKTPELDLSAMGFMAFIILCLID